jgi:hypothetical protein
MKYGIIFAACINASLIGSAAAQTSSPTGGSPLRQDTPVRVQTTINFFVPGPTGDSDEAMKLRDRARASVYEMAAKECELLKEHLARDCRLESLNSNVNINRQFGQTPIEGFSINGTMSFQITLK